MVFITFIIPTIGRETLVNSINSLIEQTDKDWEAFIIFDGIKKSHLINDERIKYFEIEKIGENKFKSMSGKVRNYGFELINIDNTEWIGFLDDDDVLSEDYIENLKKELKIFNDMEVCIFRMCYPNGYILPNINDKTIIRNKFGISFCFKSYICKKIFFKNNPYEDYFFLKELQENKYKILISSFITYYIKEKFIKKNPSFPKIKINF